MSIGFRMNTLLSIIFISLASSRKLSESEILELYGEQPLLSDLVASSSDPNVTIREAAAGRNLLMGAESAFYYFSDAPYQPTLYSQYDLTEPEK